MLDDIEIAEIAYEAIRTLRRVIGTGDSVSWAERDKALNAETVEHVKLLTRPVRGSLPLAVHNYWMQSRINAGWTHGKAYDHDAKKNPRLVAFAQLPMEIQLELYLFTSVVTVLLTTRKK